MAVAGVFVALLVTYILLTIAEFAGASALGKAGGWVGILTALIAWYASCAGVVNATWKRTVLPVGPR
jgi:succinate-acetate transporter protein